MDTAQPAPATAPYWRQQIEKALLAPIRSMRRAYLPLLMVYFAYGATGLVGVAQSFWIKNSLSWSPAELAALSVWFTLPWTIKMVFGELVDTVALFGSRRRSYVFLGASLIALSFVLLAGAAGGWITVLPADQLYVVASLISVTGVVLQDVVADAMSTEVVARVNADGTPRPQHEIDHDLGMVQVLGRLALYFGIFAVSGLAGVLAQYLSYDKVFLIGLVVPLISITGALLVRLDSSERRPIDWRILGGGIVFGIVVTLLGVTGVPFAQEIIFVISMVVVIWMLARVTREVDHDTRMRIAFAAIIIFAFRCVPGIGDGYTWFSIDVLKFDEAFFGVLGQIGAAVGIAAAWLLSDLITRKPVPQVLLWLTIMGTILALPQLLLVFQAYEPLERALGIGPRSIALFDTVASAPLVQLSMIPMLTLIAIYAPSGHRATWFALMASLMNLALTASGMLTKYLNLLFPVSRGDYHNLPLLVVIVIIVAFIVPMTVILLLGRRVR